MKKILVTGARGFVGGFISNNLNEYQIFKPLRQDLDLLNQAQVNQWFDNNQVDIVIHCALSGREVLSSLDPTYLSDGLLMFRNLWLNRHKFQKLINLGTAYEHDLSVDNTLIKEGDFLNHLPLTSYGYSKNIIARIIRETENFYNLRIFGNFHENESDQRFFKKVINNSDIFIHNDQYIDYIYMPDLLPPIRCIINDECQYRDVNMVYPNKYRLSELAIMLCEIMNLDKNKIKVLGYNGNNLTGDGSRLASFNFNLIGIEQGLRNYQ